MMGQSAAKPAPKAEPTAKPEAKATGATSVSGRVSLAPALLAKAGPDDTVYIFARPANGPRMPLAVLRVKVSDLPKDFSLDDSMAMSPDLKISSASELRIEARVSRSGDAISKPGDLSGEISPVKPGAQKLQLVIDKVVQ
jgi:cytochrome c-type biogenesis protein CcmH